jgi:hypothetical protein
MNTRAVLTVAALVLSGAVAGCGSDKPAVCGSVGDLKTSISGLSDIKLTSSGALGSLQSQLATVKSDFDAVKADAESEFSAQLQAVDASYTSLKSSADAATANPTVNTLAAAATDLSGFRSSVQTLVSDVQSTC